MFKFSALTVFCGSKYGVNSIYKQATIELGNILAQNDITLVFGGSNVGLMGTVADAVLDNGGKAIGVIPNFLTKIEVHHTGLTENISVETMHERKLIMSQKGDGFIALPGGFGTLDELFEILTWAQLGLHDKPIGLLNVDGFFDPLLQMVSATEKAGFLYQGSSERLIVDENPLNLLTKMDRFIDAPQRIVLNPERV
jgi:uncharacterized protein (TIGR00730 family)